MTAANHWIEATEDGLLHRSGVAPEPLPGEALIESILVGICGTDLHAMSGEHPFVPLPYRPGHEVVARIQSFGDDAAHTGASGESLAPGDRVVVEPPLFCGACKQCRAGRTNMCEQLTFFGTGHPQGGMARYSTIRTDRLHRVPESLSRYGAALIEPLATPVHAIRVAMGSGPEAVLDLSDSAVVVIGTGTIGLMVVAAARWAGVRRLITVDPLAGKRELALRLGADTAIDANTPDLAVVVRKGLGESADVVFDCVSTQSTVDTAVTLAAKGGTVVTVGVPVGRVSVDLPLIQDAQIRLQGSITYTAADYRTAIEILASGAIDADSLVSFEGSLEAIEDSVAAARGGHHVKVVVHP